MTMNLEKLEREAREQRQLRARADTPEGRTLAKQFDENELKRAAAQGDATALQDVLRRVLSTPEGQTLAEKVYRAVGKK